MKTILIALLLFITVACSKGTSTIKNPPQVNPVPVCTGTIFDGTLDVSFLDPNVDLTGALSSNAQFVLNNSNQCVIQSCDAGYNVSADQLSCEAIACTIANSNILNATSVTGDIVSGCTVTACSTNYEVNPSTNSCDAISCTPSNSGIANVLSVTGDLVSGCTVTSCQSGYENISNACQPIACTIANSNIPHATSVIGTFVTGCSVTACSVNYSPASDFLSCIPNACTTSMVPNSTGVSGDVVSGCSATSCVANYEVNGNQCSPISCNLGNANILNATAVSGDLVSGCTVTSCSANYEVNPSTNSCDAISCTPANSGIANVLSVSGNLVTGCTVTSCQSNYEISGNLCTPISCTPSNSGIANVLSVTGDLVSGCSVTACQINYTQNGNLCEATLCSPSDIPNATAVSGDLVNGCTVTACSSNYEVNPSTNSCDPILCTPSNSGIANVLSVSGDLVGGCNVTSCQTNYTQNGNLCEATLCSPSDIPNSTAVTGDLVSGCTVTSCQPNYSPNGTNTSCEAIACTVANANILNATAVSGDLVNGCTVTACSTNYQVNTSTNSCDTMLCTVANANILHASEVSGFLSDPECTLVSCESGYEKVGNSCQAISCTPANSGIANVLTVSGYIPTGCNLVECQPLYTPNFTDNLCEQSPCSLVNSLGHGISDLSNVASVSGYITDNSCVVSSCNDFYKIENNLCVAKGCSDLSASEATLLGFNLTGGSLTGTYPSCTLTCASSLQELAVDGKSCVDKTPTIGMNLPDYSNQSNTNASITVTNTEKVRYYSDDTCSTLIEEVNSPVMDGNYVYSFNVGGPLGLKNRSVKAINGSLESSCVSDSVYFDNINPIVSITSPVTGFDLLSNSIEVTGTCGDSDSGIASVLITVGGVLDFPTTCNSGIYSETVNVANLPDGQVEISVVVTDNSGNQATESTSVDKNTYGSIQGVFSGGGVYALYRQADGKLLVAGNFSNFIPNGEASVACWSVARINANGTLDKDFCDNVRVNGPSKEVKAITTDLNNNIIIVGNFTGWGATPNKTMGVAKLNADGSLNEIFAENLLTRDGSNNIIVNQSGFQSSSTLSLNAVVTDSNNNIYVGGNFTSFKGVNFETRAIAKLSPNGILDPTFTSNLNPLATNCSLNPQSCGFNRNRTGTSLAEVQSLLIVDNALFVGGMLGKYGNDVGFSSSLLAKLSLDGILDTTFRNNNFNSTQRWKSGLGPTLSETGAGTAQNVAVSALYSDGTSLFVGGSFRHYGGTFNNARGLAKFSLDGVFDTNFSTNIGWGLINELNSSDGYTVKTIQESLDGDLIIGGTFSHFGGHSILSGIYEPKVTGTTESTYHSSASSLNQLNVYGGPSLTVSGYTEGSTTLLDRTYNSGDAIDSTDRIRIFRDNTETSNAGKMLKITKNGVFDTAFSDSLDVVSGVKIHSAQFATSSPIPSGVAGTVTSLLVDFAGNLYLSSTTLIQYKNHSTTQERSYVLKILPDMTLAD